jgi:GTP cyclohydrolase II
MTDLVYNSRKRGGDSADRYFKATEMIAGVKDMRFQAIMPDTLHWLGVQKIDNMISMVRPCFSSCLSPSIIYKDTDCIERYEI